MVFDIIYNLAPFQHIPHSTADPPSSNYICLHSDSTQPNQPIWYVAHLTSLNGNAHPEFATERRVGISARYDKGGGLAGGSGLLRL